MHILSVSQYTTWDGSKTLALYLHTTKIFKQTHKGQLNDRFPQSPRSHRFGYWQWVTWTNSRHSVNLLTSLKSNKFKFRVVFAEFGNFTETFSSRSRSNLQFWDARMTLKQCPGHSSDVLPPLAQHLQYNICWHWTHGVSSGHHCSWQRQGEIEEGRNWLEHKIEVEDLKVNQS